VVKSAFSLDLELDRDDRSMNNEQVVQVLVRNVRGNVLNKQVAGEVLVDILVDSGLGLVMGQFVLALSNVMGYEQVAAVVTLLLVQLVDGGRSAGRVLEADVGRVGERVITVVLLNESGGDLTEVLEHCGQLRLVGILGEALDKDVVASSDRGLALLSVVSALNVSEDFELLAFEFTSVSLGNSIGSMFLGSVLHVGKAS